MLFWLCSAVLVAATLAGGGTHNGFYGDVFIQLLSIALLVSVLWNCFDKDRLNQPGTRLFILICATASLVTIIEVFPLPFDYWPGIEVFLPPAASPTVTGEGSGVHTLSIVPQTSWAAAASLITPVAIFGAVIRFRLRERLIICSILSGLAALSLVLGFLQVAQGPGSVLRFYEFTNPLEAVGFFANRNHFAAQLYVTLILAAFWLMIAVNSALEQKGALQTHSILWVTAAALFIVADVSGLALARSRAGIFLAIAGLAGITLMILVQPRKARRSNHAFQLTRRRALLVTIAFAVIFATQLGLGRILTRFEGDQLEDLRVALNRTVLAAVPKVLPFGSGLGSLVPVYSAAERTEDVFEGYANRAHDDFAELLLETGVLGAGVIAGFLFWFFRCSFRVWRPADPQGGSVERLLERSATIIIALLLIHSLVDYPLRTGALSAVFAFFCAILAAPAPAEPVETAQHQPRRGANRDKAPIRPVERWDPQADWPKEWQS
jgi:hypothetical protein